MLSFPGFPTLFGIGVGLVVTIMLIIPMIRILRRRRPRW